MLSSVNVVNEVLLPRLMIVHERYDFMGGVRQVFGLVWFGLTRLWLNRRITFEVSVHQK
jgi:hypothetical protein